MKSALRTIDPLLVCSVVGFGLIFAWGTCLWDIPLPYLNGTPITVEQDIWFLSALITPIAFFVLAPFCRKRELSYYTHAPLAGVLFAAIGTLCVYFSPFTLEPLRNIFELLASIGTGLGPVLLVTLWACFFTKLDLDLVERIVPLSFAMTLICSLVMAVIPFWAALVLTVLFPVISGLCLVRANRLLVDTPAVTYPLNVARSETIAPGNIARMICAFFIIATLACLIPFTGYQATISSEALCTTVGVLLAIGLTVAWTSFSRHINLESLVRWLTIPVTLLILSPVIPLPAGAYLSRILSNVVFIGLDIVLVLYFTQLSQRTHITESSLIGLGAGAAYLGVLVGGSVRRWLTSYIEIHPSDVALLCLLMLSVYVLTMLIVPRRDAVLSPQAWERAVGGPDVAGAGDTTPASVLSGNASANLSNETSWTNWPDCSSELNQANRFQPTQWVSTPEGQTPSATSPSTTPAAACTASVHDQRVSVAQSFGLSPRETEIFLLLAQGRSRPYIRDALFLSKNTVATHIRHIYEKMDIHSQQELIDLVQESTRM